MAREDATRASIDAFLRELGRRFNGRGALYLVGGSMLVYQGFRPRTLDIDYIERGQERDIDDVLALCRAGVIHVSQIAQAFEEIAPRIETEALPRITEPDFRRKVTAFMERAHLEGVE